MQANAQRKEQRKRENEARCSNQDEPFAFIAGYTSSGASYGATRKEWNLTETEAQTPQPRQIYGDDELSF